MRCAGASQHPSRGAEVEASDACGSQGTPRVASAERARERRRAIRISDVDQRRIERGELPSWLEPQRPETEYFLGPDAEESSGGGRRNDPQSSSQNGSGTNDQRLLEDVPPHW